MKSALAYLAVFTCVLILFYAPFVALVMGATYLIQSEVR